MYKTAKSYNLKSKSRLFFLNHARPTEVFGGKDRKSQTLRITETPNSENKYPQTGQWNTVH